MHANPRPAKPKGIRTSALFHTVWITTATLVLFDVSSDRSAIRSFISPRSAGDTVVDQVAAARAFGGQPRSAKVTTGSAHTYFNFKESPAVEAGEPVRQIDLVGQWTGAVDANSVGSLWSSGSCEYEIRNLDFQLRASGNDVYGYGTYTLLSERCPEAELVTRYASATGQITAPYVKLNIKNNGSGKTDLVFYGTVEDKGIRGQVRSGYGELMAEHVTLVRR